ncbi:MAG TPA: GyrI-like domain-containing protein [Devosia sp.]|nr:GyrI-like domain-containing protein [Devosia sp.]
MLTLPKVVTRPETTYYAIRRKVRIPFTAVIDEVMPTMGGWFSSHGIERPGPAVFRYDTIKMPALEMEFGHIHTGGLATAGEVRAGSLPAGDYAAITYWGHYKDLEEVNAVLIGWARLSGLALDVAEDEAGDRFAGRFELYPNGPMDEPDPSKWETQVFIRLRD